MRKFYTLFCFVFSLSVFSQVTTTVATYSLGDISTDFGSALMTNSTNSSCPGVLNVPVPSGRFVVSIDVEYDMEAMNLAWQTEQRSYLECVTTGNKENVVAGPSLTVNGTHSYARTGLNIANGAVGAGGIQFKLHAFRTWGGTGCNSTFQKVVNNTFKITVHHGPMPTCFAPTNLNVSSIGTNNVTLGWTTGGASNWQIEYGPAGFLPGSGTIVNATTNPFILGGLSSGTSYDFRVRDSCGVNDISFWSNSARFRTNCSVIIAPYTQDFESPDWIPSTGFGDIGKIDTCYTRNYSNNFTWEAGPPSFTSTVSGPAGDHTSGNGKYMFTQMNSFSSGSATATIFTPPIDLSTLNTPELTFWYHMYGFNIGNFTLSISNDGGVTYSSLLNLNGVQQNSKTSPWKEALVNISAYANDTIILKFTVVQSNTGFNGDAAIDDISIHEQPSCPKPSNLKATAMSNGFVLDWTSGGASNWQIEYGPRGFTPGNGTLINAGSNPFTLNGLNPATIYDLYVRDSCGVNDVSKWSLLKTDTTLCAVFNTPYSQNFDGPLWQQSTSFFDPGIIDFCWNRSDTLSYIWRPQQLGTTTFNTGPDKDHTSGSGKYLYTHPRTTANNVSYLYSPALDLSPLANPELRFWFHMFGSSISQLAVEIWNGTNWVNISAINGQQQTSETAPWQEKVISLAAYANDTVQIRFKATRVTNGFFSHIAIDDFWIGESPTCTRPSNITVNNRTTTGFNVNWTSGGATNWLLGYRIAGSGAPLTIVPVSAKPFTLTGLSPSQSYEIYVRDSCGLNDVSLWLGPHFTTTLCGLVTAPWSENFEGSNWITGTGFNNAGNQISNCWSRSMDNTQFGTRMGPSPAFNSGTNAGLGNTGKYILLSGGTFNASAHISSPQISIPNSLDSVKLIYAYHMYGVNITDLKVSINNGSGYTVIKTISGQQHNSKSAPWLFDTISLANYSGDSIQIRFMGNVNGFNSNISIDGVEITGSAMACPEPTNMVISNIALFSADLSWNGTGNSFDIEVVPLGQPQGSGTSYNTANPPFSINGLSSSTTYVVYLRTKCQNSINSNWVTDTFTTNSCALLAGGFNHTRNILDINFSSTASNADSLWWDFGDGNGNSLTNPLHTYATAGSYTVYQYVFNICGEADTFSLNIEVCDTLLADFSYFQSKDTIYFNGSGSMGATQHFWVLSNGDSIFSSSHNYLVDTAGTFNISLFVYNNCGDTNVITKTITACAPPLAYWIYTNKGTTSAGMKIQFDGTASQNAVSWDWDFGDGNTSGGSPTPLHVYAVPSLAYIVELTVANACGDVHKYRYALNQIGLEEQAQQAGIEIYPIPVHDNMILEWVNENNVPEKILIYDVQGKLIKLIDSPEYIDNKLIISLVELNKAVYFIQITTESGTTKKIFLKD